MVLLEVKGRTLLFFILAISKCLLFTCEKERIVDNGCQAKQEAIFYSVKKVEIRDFPLAKK